MRGFIIVIIKLTCKRKSKTFRLLETITVTFFVLIYVLNPIITKVNFSLFNCFVFEDGHTYLRRDITIECWTGSHMAQGVHIASTLIILWAFLFPLTIAIILFRNRKSLAKEKTLRVFGVFYVGLTDQNFYWEILIVNLRKVCLIVLATFMKRESQSLKVISFFN